MEQGVRAGIEASTAGHARHRAAPLPLISVDAVQLCPRAVPARSAAPALPTNCSTLLALLLPSLYTHPHDWAATCPPSPFRRRECNCGSMRPTAAQSLPPQPAAPCTAPPTSSNPQAHTPHNWQTPALPHCLLRHVCDCGSARRAPMRPLTINSPNLLQLTVPPPPSLVHTRHTCQSPAATCPPHSPPRSCRTAAPPRPATGTARRRRSPAGEAGHTSGEGSKGGQHGTQVRGQQTDEQVWSGQV